MPAAQAAADKQTGLDIAVQPRDAITVGTSGGELTQQALGLFALGVAAFAGDLVQDGAGARGVAQLDIGLREVELRVDIVAALPRNPTGKILKRDLRQPYWDDQQRQV